MLSTATLQWDVASSGLKFIVFAHLKRHCHMTCSPAGTSTCEALHPPPAQPPPVCLAGLPVQLRQQSL
eukprot:2431004-Amphidinium_carterae.1